MLRRLLPSAVGVLCALGVITSSASADRRLNDVRPPPAPMRVCMRVVANSSSYQDVKIIGTVEQGGHQKLRKLLVLVDERFFAVQPGDCLARERVPVERIIEHMLPPADDRGPQKLPASQTLPYVG